eukprot:2190071-Prymnesium_polylepis.1
MWVPPYDYEGSSSRWDWLIRIPAGMDYSLSFNFTQLRFCPRGPHTARQAAADTRSSAEEPA